MSDINKIRMFLLLNFLVVAVLVIIGMYLVRLFMRLLNPGFWCNATIVSKEPEYRTSTSTRGLSSTFYVYTITMELDDSLTRRYIVPLDVYVDLEIDRYYEFYIETNEIQEYKSIAVEV